MECLTVDNQVALNPKNCVVVEACAGSGKTWLLVSRIVRLLLDGVKPSEILAITFTRKAAQEMQARLHEWLHLLAVEGDESVRQFLNERAVNDVDDALLSRARGLYRDALLAQPALTISTFHGWFMQIIQRAPLNAGVPVGMQLLERTSALRDEAWQAFVDSLRAAPDGETAQRMQWLFAEYGLHSTRGLLENFVHKRAEWWAYTQGQEEAASWAVGQLRAELCVDEDADPIAEACVDASFKSAVYDFARALATGTETQCNQANNLQIAWEVRDPHQRFAGLLSMLYTQADEPRSFKSTKKQDATSFLLARDALFEKMQFLRDALTEKEVFRLNQAALPCGAALLGHYQELKLRSQQMDFTDLEWQVCRLLNQSECAEYMQYKLDSRYKHVLLDEFQDTNPLQWQILQSWFSAAAAVDSKPVVFVVGDPKQSIYRFRRADSRLFGEVSNFMQHTFGADFLAQNVTRRNSPVVLEVVNKIFSTHPDGFIDFENHGAHHQDLPGHVEVLPLSIAEELPPLDETTSHSTKLQETAVKSLVIPPGEGWGGGLRNPLTTPHVENQSGAREAEAEQFAAQIADIVSHWNVRDEHGTQRRATYGDIMVLVRKRTHLRVYEHALRARHIPFLTSRRGGLLDTLEAEDIQALLTFLITPFADLELAQALRSPLFSCSDKDLMQIAGEDEGTWWSRLQRLMQNQATSDELQRACNLLQNWLPLSDKLPVHDLLDRIYFEGDLLRRYLAALPVELHETVQANLRAFMEIALNVDAGRYPSLPHFLAELNELRAAENESPDEGKVGEVGNALRIYTVHEAKGLEAPIVWLLDANDVQRKTDSYSVLLDWQPNESRPSHFSLFSDKRGRGAKRAKYFDADEAYALREEMNLLYVAITRAKQALLVSGNGELVETSWYGRIAAAQPDGTFKTHDTVTTTPLPNPPPIGEGTKASPDGGGQEGGKTVAYIELTKLKLPIPTGKRIPRLSTEQRRGIWLHGLLQHMVHPQAVREKSELQILCGIPADEMGPLLQQALQLIALPHLQRFFNPQLYRQASNELSYVNARGELKRIDRLVEFEDELWVLDYKTGIKSEIDPYRAQMQEYRAAMQAVYPGRKVRCALLFGEGDLIEVE
jgi:ATP-dependent helicase/nuclease subunit A